MIPKAITQSRQALSEGKPSFQIGYRVLQLHRDRIRCQVFGLYVVLGHGKLTAYLKDTKLVKNITYLSGKSISVSLISSLDADFDLLFPLF